MRIQTRLFLGTATLVLALMGLQWWLYARQLRSIEDDFSSVAATVGTGVLTAERTFFGNVVKHDADGILVMADRLELIGENAEDQADRAAESEIRMMVVPGPPEKQAEGDRTRRIIRKEIEPSGDVVVEERFEWTSDGSTTQTTHVMEVDGELHKVGEDVAFPAGVTKLIVNVEPGETRHDQFLVVREGDQDLHRIKIPVAPTVERVEEGMLEGAMVGGGLLLIGLFASAVLSRRLTQPLRALADGAEAVGQGDLGVQVPVSATGEVGDLQRSFNRMSQRLQELEGERQMWQQREHLAQLGDLSRGLAHTLRNPLHTLGLAVEELADGDSGRRDLVATSRAQIRRIDRWLCSFLALGAEESAEPEDIDLGELVKGVALESVQQGADIRVEEIGELRVEVVPGAIRAALSNLIENATQASPDGETVSVKTWNDGDVACVEIVDRGNGLPPEVKERLFSPHVTTKVGGSGMGLFLARQLIVGMHGGILQLEDGDDGGTVATIRLPLVGGNRDGGESGGE